MYVLLIQEIVKPHVECAKALVFMRETVFKPIHEYLNGTRHSPNWTLSLIQYGH